MNKQESWMPTDAEIREVFPAMTYAQRSKVAIIRCPGARALTFDLEVR